MRKNAFTLVELLIVIVIIGILATIAMPQYQKMVTRSKLAGMWITLGALKEAVQIYRTEYNKAPAGNHAFFRLDSTILNNNNIGVDFDFNKYALWWATLPDGSSARNCTENMNISSSNMAFYICPANPYLDLPHACMSEEGKKSYCISGTYYANANWIFE